MAFLPVDDLESINTGIDLSGITDKWKYILPPFCRRKIQTYFFNEIVLFCSKFRCNFQMIHLKIAQHYFRYCPDTEEAYSFLICSQRNGCLSCQQSLAFVSLSSRAIVDKVVLGIWRLLEADLRFVGVFCEQWFGYVLLSINAKPLI